MDVRHMPVTRTRGEVMRLFIYLFVYLFILFDFVVDAQQNFQSEGENLEFPLQLFDLIAAYGFCRLRESSRAC